MPRNKLPNVEVLEPLEDPIQIVENIGDLVEDSKKEYEDPFVQPEQQKAEPPLNYNNLTAKKLKMLCKEAGYRNYSKLKKNDLIKMIKGEDVTIPEKLKPKKSITIDIEKDEVIPKEKKIEPKSPIKKEELKDNLVKDEVLIKNKVEEEVEVEVTDEELEEILEPPPKPKKTKPVLKPRVQKLKPPQPILPPPQPILPPPPQQKELYNPFKNYYNIY